MSLSDSTARYATLARTDACVAAARSLGFVEAGRLHVRWIFRHPSGAVLSVLDPEGAFSCVLPEGGGRVDLNSLSPRLFGAVLGALIT